MRLKFFENSARKTELKPKWKKFEARSLLALAFFYPQRGETCYVIHETADASSPWATLKNGLPTARFSISTASLPIVVSVCVCVWLCVHTQSDFGFISRQRIMMTLSLHNNPARTRPELCQTAAEILLRRSLLTHLLQAYLHTHWHAHSDTFIPCLSLFLSLFLSILADWSARGSQFPFLALFFACWVFYLARFFYTDSCFSLIEWNLGVLF